jgi:hypothetical protein
MFGMFTNEGNAKVEKIVADALNLKNMGYGVEGAWNWTLNALSMLAALEGFDEAEDTAVREAVYDAVVCG